MRLNMMLMVNNPMANPKLVEAWSFQSGFVARCDSPPIIIIIIIG